MLNPLKRHCRTATASLVCNSRTRAAATSVDDQQPAAVAGAASETRQSAEEATPSAAREDIFILIPKLLAVETSADGSRIRQIRRPRLDVHLIDSSASPGASFVSD